MCAPRVKRGPRVQVRLGEREKSTEKPRLQTRGLVAGPIKWASLCLMEVDHSHKTGHAIRRPFHFTLAMHQSCTPHTLLVSR